MKIYTDSDFDGLISAYLLKQIHPETEVIFTNPSGIKKLSPKKEDIISDLPRPEGFEGTHYDHHTPYTETSIKKDSCAEVIIKLNPKLISGRNRRLAKAASKIDTAKLTKNYTPEETISLTLSLKGKQKDNQYRQWILTKLEEGKTLQQICLATRVQERLTKKIEQIKKFIKKTQKELTEIYGIKFITIKGYISPAHINKIFEEEEPQYIIKNHKEHIMITANVYKTNPVDLAQIVKKIGGQGKKNRAHFTGEQYLKTIMENIAITYNEATEHPPGKK